MYPFFQEGLDFYMKFNFFPLEKHQKLISFCVNLSKIFSVERFFFYFEEKFIKSLFFNRMFGKFSFMRRTQSIRQYAFR